MSGLNIEFNTGTVTFSTSTKTVIRANAPTNQRGKLKEWGISFDGISNTAAPILVQLLRVTTDGTMTSLTPTKDDNGLSETIQFTGGHTASAEPTPGDILRSIYIHPQTGRDYVSPFGEEIMIPGGTKIAIRVVTPGAGADCAAYFKIEE